MGILPFRSATQKRKGEKDSIRTKTESAIGERVETEKERTRDRSIENKRNRNREEERMRDRIGERIEDEEKYP